MKNLQIMLILLISLTIPNIITAQTFLWEESFDPDPGNWTLEANWSITLGYLQFNWTPTQTNYSLSATSPVITLPANTGDLHITQWINYFTNPASEAFEIAVLVGDTAHVLWSHSNGIDWGSSGGELLTLSLIPFQNEDIQLRFRSWGSTTWNINYWRIYHLGIEESFDNDLEASAISGNTTPSAGIPTDYTVEIRNNGVNTQTDYTVKLMQEGNVEISSVPGNPITAGQAINYVLSWTPLTEGQTSLYGEVVLAADEVPDNNITPSLNVFVHQEGSVAVTVGTETNLSYEIPFNFYWRNSLTQTIYMASELNIGGLLTGISYYNSFQTNIANHPTRIWVGETDQDNLTDGWIPSTELELVFNGNLDFPNGVNEISISFDPPYVYNGGNLVVMAQRPMDTTYHSSMDRFYYSNSPLYPDRTRHQHSDYIEFDPANPTDGTLLSSLPNSTFFFVTAGMGMVEGYVYDASSNSPMAGVSIEILNTSYTTSTINNGYFAIPYLPEGYHDVQASIFGYYISVLEDVLIEEDETTTVNFSLTQLPTVTVSGRIVGSDQPDIGLGNALIAMDGYFFYQTGNNPNGFFSIPGVYADQIYQMTVQRNGYSDLNIDIPVGDTDLDLGDVIVNELAFPPAEVNATILPNNLEVHIDWTPPANMTLDMSRYDYGVIGPDSSARSVPDIPSAKVMQDRNCRIIRTNNPNPDLSGSVDNFYQRSSDRILIGFIIYRLPAGEEENHQTWDEIATIPSTETSVRDTGLPGLLNGIYLYAVRSLYSNNVLSDYTLSNPIFYEEQIPDIVGLEANLDTEGVELTWDWAYRDTQATARSKYHPISTKNRTEERAFIGFLITRNGNLIAEEVLETHFTDDYLPPGNSTTAYTVIGVFTNGSTNMLHTELITSETGEADTTIPSNITMLSGNTPNPFNPSTTIHYSLERSERVKIEIFDVRGRLVTTLIDKMLPAGSYAVTWDGIKDLESVSSSGIYFYRMTAGSFVSTKKMLMIK